MSNISQSVYQFLAQNRRLWLFLDYDGTLADFATTPEQVDPDPQIAELVGSLARDPRIRVAVISGRRLSQVEKLVPVAEAFLAGTYGIEIRTPTGQRIDRLDYETVRPVLAKLKPLWADLIDGSEGFFLEDKGWSLALHGRFVPDDQCEQVLAEARRVVDRTTAGASLGLYQLLGGHKFLEMGPQLAHKGKTVHYLLSNFLWPGAQLLYLGDDDKDEAAFKTIHDYGGKAIIVTSQSKETAADGRLDSPHATRRWLQAIPQELAAVVVEG